jgi:hypothetical protein
MVFLSASTAYNILTALTLDYFEKLVYLETSVTTELFSTFAHLH